MLKFTVFKSNFIFKLSELFMMSDTWNIKVIFFIKNVISLEQYYPQEFHFQGDKMLFLRSLCEGWSQKNVIYID